MSSAEIQTMINWDEMALVRPISAPGDVNWDEMALVRPISAPGSIDITFGTELTLPEGFVINKLLPIARC